jgi:hypothetical protein
MGRTAAPKNRPSVTPELVRNLGTLLGAIFVGAIVLPLRFLAMIKMHNAFVVRVNPRDKELLAQSRLMQGIKIDPIFVSDLCQEIHYDITKLDFRNFLRIDIACPDTSLLFWPYYVDNYLLLIPSE